MRTSVFATTAIVLSLAQLTGFAAAGEPYVADYYGDKEAAFSFTFDDGFRHQVENALEIIDPLDIKGTFFLIPLYMEDPERADKFITWDLARKMLANGHEIGTHGSIQVKLQEAPDEELDYLVNESWRIIAKQTGKEPISFAVPGGTNRKDPRVIEKVMERHYFLRGPVIGYGSTETRNWTDEGTRQRIRKGIQEGEWMVGMVHAIVEGWSPFKSKDEFRIHCEWLKQQEEELWIAPMGDVGRYVKEREAAKLEVRDRREQSLVFTLKTEAEPDEVFDYPLTVVIPVKGVKEAKAGQGNESVSVIVEADCLLVNVAPNGQEVSVEWVLERK